MIVLALVQTNGVAAPISIARTNRGSRSPRAVDAGVALLDADKFRLSRSLYDLRTR